MYKFQVMFLNKRSSSGTLRVTAHFKTRRQFPLSEKKMGINANVPVSNTFSSLRRESSRVGGYTQHSAMKEKQKENIARPDSETKGFLQNMMRKCMVKCLMIQMENMSFFRTGPAGSVSLTLI